MDWTVNGTDREDERQPAADGDGWRKERPCDGTAGTGGEGVPSPMVTASAGLAPVPAETLGPARAGGGDRTPGIAACDALRVDGVSHSYGERKALDDVSFTVPAGSFTALLGPNGAGKSTLFSLITRLFNVRHGTISILGHALADEPGEALRRLGVVFQARTLDLDLSIAQNLKYHASLHGIPGGLARSRIDEILSGSDLQQRLGEKARNLSGGQLRRIEIVRAFMHRPQLILLDEPTVGLDIRSRADIVAEVRRLVKDEGVSVLWATHLIDEIDEDDRVVVLHHGHVLAEGPVPEVVEAESAGSIRDAFTRLTGLSAPRAESGALR